MVVTRGLGLLFLLGCCGKILDRNNREERFISVHGFRNSSPSEGKARWRGGRCGGVSVIWSVEEANIIPNGEAEWPGLGTRISFRPAPSDLRPLPRS